MKASIESVNGEVALGMAKQQRRRNGEAGVSLILVALSTVVTVYIVITFGFVTAIVKRARADIETQLTSFCAIGAREQPITRAAVGKVAELFDYYLQSKGFRNATVRTLTVFAPSISLRVDPSSAITPHLPAQNISPCPSGVTCSYVGDVNDPRMIAAFPDRFWDNAQFGDALACEVTAEVSDFFGGTRTIRVRTAWTNRQIGALDPTISATVNQVGPRAIAGGPVQIPQLGGGVTIGIAPQMQTDATRLQFQFPGTALSRFNPLRDFDPGPGSPSSGVRGFAFTRPPLPTFNRAGQPAIQLPNSQSLSDSSRRERLAACANPITVGRNAILSGLIGKLSRGWQRDKTALLLVSSQRAGLGSARPVLMTEEGSDLMQQLYELPFDPTEQNPSPGPALGITVRSLRDCFHLYEGANLGPSGIDRFRALINNNQGFEPVPLDESSFGTSLAPGYGGGQPWEQRDVTAEYLTTAEQTVAMLGSAQRCPAGNVSGGPPDSDCSRPTPNFDPNAAPNDLRGDLVAFMRYLLNDDGTGNPFPAIAAPGHSALFPQTQWVTRPRRSLSSVVIVVLHQRITQAEANVIGPLVDQFRSNPTERRRIMVLYFPSTGADSSQSAVQRIGSAFRVTAEPIPRPDQNLMFVFGPQSAPPGGTSEADWDRHIQNFWVNTSTGPGQPQLGLLVPHSTDVNYHVRNLWAVLVDLQRKL